MSLASPTLAGGFFTTEPPEMRVRSLGREDLLEKEWQSTLVFLPGKFHEQRSLEGYTPWGREEADLTEHARHTFYALKAILIKTEAPSHSCLKLGF